MKKEKPLACCSIWKLCRSVAAFIGGVVEFQGRKSNEGRRRRHIFLRDLRDALVMSQLQQWAATAATLEKPITMEMDMQMYMLVKKTLHVTK